MELKERIRTAREARQLNQRELAEKADVALSLVVKLEGGKRDAMTTTTATKLAGALGCSLEWLIAGTGDAPGAAA